MNRNFAHSYILRRTATTFLMLAALFVISAPTAEAAAKPKWAAKEVQRSVKQVQVAPGRSVDFTIAFKNVGSETWVMDGGNFVSVYTYGPKYRRSKFSDVSWPSNMQAARLTEAKVAPGQVGHFTFTLFAPLEAGTYKETFILAAEDKAWLTGGTFTVDVRVNAKYAKAGDDSAPGYKALRMLANARDLSLNTGDEADLRVSFKNVGITTWKKGGKMPLVLKPAAGNIALAFMNSTWTGSEVVTALAEDVKPGQMTTVNFKLTAPRMAGSYRPKFVLAASTGVVDGGVFELPVEVTVQTPVVSSVDEISLSDFRDAGSRGPNIRIGLFSTTEPIVIAAPGPYRMLDYNDQLVRELSGLSTVTFDFNAYQYTVTNNGWSWTSPRHMRFTPLDPASSIFEIQSYVSRPTWDPSINFNRFRGDLEVMYSSATEKLWTIEELPVEDYMRGLAETSNGSPQEFQKALVTAARTYALFVKLIGGKHPKEYFDMVTNGNDQVYKGYVSELVRPTVVKAAEDTRGMVVTYDGELVVTPYFSRSDGRTRSWTEVWSSKVHPWLVSVPAPYDAGKELWGHGVGMSASDAVGRARAGVSWTEILKYYYTGIGIQRAY